MIIVGIISDGQGLILLCSEKVSIWFYTYEGQELGRVSAVYREAVPPFIGRDSRLRLHPSLKA